jgi:DNA-binding protein HU-beta
LSDAKIAECAKALRGAGLSLQCRVPNGSSGRSTRHLSKGKPVNKRQLIESLASRFDGSKRDAQHALESVVDTITREVSRGEKVAITGFGAFEKIDRPARMVRNPATGERSRAKKTSVPKFRPGADLKAYVSGAKKMPKATAASSTSTAKKSSSRKTSASNGTSGSARRKTTTAKKSTGKKTSTGRKTSARSSTGKKTSTTKRAAKKS